MTIDRVETAQHWGDLLSYYTDCLEEEHRLQYVIRRDRVFKTCFFAASLNGDFVRQKQSFCSVAYTDNRGKQVESLQSFVLGDPNGGRRPTTCFGYPFYVGREQQLIPLIYVHVSGDRDDRGVMLTRESTDLEINFAAIWDALPGDKSIAFDDLLARFENLEDAPGDSRFERILSLLIAKLEEVSGSPVQRMEAEKYRPGNLPRNTIVDCPLLFHVTNLITGQVLRELGQLRRRNWDEAQPVLHQLLARSVLAPYPDPPEPAQDPRLYVMPANEKQRQVILSAEQRSLTVVTGPPGTGKSQLIVNIVGNAILRGESVLIASRNNQAVDTISERFLNRMDYPGAVRTGKTQYRQQLPGQMQETLARLRRGGLTSQLAQVRSRHEELLNRIQEKNAEIAHIRALEADRQAYEVELRELLELLPEGVRGSFGKVRVRFGEGEYPRLMAVTRELIEGVDALVQRRAALTGEAKAILAENRDGLLLLEQLKAMERQAGLSLDEIRHGIPLDSLFSIDRYLTAWQSLMAHLTAQEEVRHRDEAVARAQQRAQECQEGLPDEWLKETDSVMNSFDPNSASRMCDSLDSLQERIRTLVVPYGKFFDCMTAVVNESPLITRALELLQIEDRDDAWTRTELDLPNCGKLFGLQGSLLSAHETVLDRNSIQQQLMALEKECAARLREFDAILADLEVQTSSARAQVPAILVAEVEAAAEKSDSRAWQDVTARLVPLNEWCSRVDRGQLTLKERLRQLFFRAWALRDLQARLAALRPLMESVGLLDLRDTPGDSDPFSAWADFTRDLARFSRAVSLLGHREHVARQRDAYRQQMERDTGTKAAELERLEARFQDRIATLPANLSQAMSEAHWPSGPVASATVEELSLCKEQYEAVAAEYAAVVRELEAMTRKYPVPEPVLVCLSYDRSGIDQRGRAASPEMLLDLVSNWLRFSRTVEAKRDLQRAERELGRAKGRMNQARTGLPARIREVDFAGIEYTDDVAAQAERSVSSLRKDLLALMAARDKVREQSRRLLQQNSLSTSALEKALSQAQRNPDYLSGLANAEPASLRELASILRVWLLVFQAWSVTSQLGRLNKEIGQHPTSEEALSQRQQLLEERQSLAGQVLTEHWRHVALELDPDVLSQIGSCLDAMQALTQNVGAQYSALRRQADSSFAQALKLFPIWSTTNLSTQDLPLQARLFDCVIIDEASQCDIPSALPLLFRAKRAVIIGDQMQLRHIASLPAPLNGQLCARHTIGPRYSFIDKSLFDLAASSVEKEPGQILLREHYRSHKEIIQFASENFYDGQLSIQTDLDRIPLAYQTRACGVCWMDVRGTAERPGAGEVFNAAEVEAVADLIAKLVLQLDLLDMSEAGIGVVTPFRAQKERIEQAIAKRGIPKGRVQVGTIHTYQGDERDIMIFSPVATKELPETTLSFIARDRNLLNVAITRARLTLCVMGDHGFFKDLAAAPDYRKLAVYAEKLGRIYRTIEALPIFQPIEEEERPFDIGQGIALRLDAPYSNRMTLRRLLASCQDFVWWYDPYMNLNALDALSLALLGTDTQIREVRLLTSDEYWEKKGTAGAITKKHMVALKRELEQRGVKLQLALTRNDPTHPSSHDRYLFAANRSVNMPPIKNIYQETARLAEFLPSTIRSEEFEEWWHQATIAFE